MAVLMHSDLMKTKPSGHTYERSNTFKETHIERDNALKETHNVTGLCNKAKTKINCFEIIYYNILLFSN